ncbi:hypothetical protein ACC724_39875, partial [Rhizobium ruizarguesonis]
SRLDIAFSYCHLREGVRSQAVSDVQRSYSEIAAQIVSKIISTEVREVFPLENVRRASAHRRGWRRARLRHNRAPRRAH